MDSAAEFPILEDGGVRVASVAHLHAASLRYFERDGHFAMVLRQISGMDLPDVLKVSATSLGRGELVFAWRSPTETLLLSDDAAAFEEVTRRLESATDGCLVVQTGGLIVLAVQGDKAPELLRRLGSDGSVPAMGEARTSRLAELPVMSLSMTEGVVWLVVERVYLAHLRGWIEKTLADLN